VINFVIGNPVVKNIEAHENPTPNPDKISDTSL
jgi:hypothetical protein